VVDDDDGEREERDVVAMPAFLPDTLQQLHIAGELRRKRRLALDRLESLGGEAGRHLVESRACVREAAGERAGQCGCRIVGREQP
jgi:hypothetical protein